MARETVHVKGLRELNKAFALAGKEAKTEMRSALKDVAEPVRRAAEEKALVQISGMTKSADWSRMRTGLTQRVAYVAPRRRSRGGSKRRNLAPLLLTRAMIPALNENRPRVILAMERVLDKVGKRWERA